MVSGIGVCSGFRGPPPNIKAAATTPASPLRNVAFRRAVWHSSAANYDNTGQLISDGILGVLSNEVIDTGGTTASNPTYGQMIPGKVNSEWISASGGVQWVYLDFGAVTSLRRVKVHWGANYAITYDIQVSNDARTWETVAGASGAADSAVETELATPEGRYLRILCKTSSGANYIIREVEVTGSNSVDYRLAAQPAPGADGFQKLTGGSWTIQRASLVDAGGETLSRAGYDDSGWLPATVPGTAFVSWLNAGAVPDPHYDDWQFQASDIFFTADFWYRNSFVIPASRKGRKVYLNFDAVNWKADVWFNGQFLANTLPGYAHSIEGAFIRSKFDVSQPANYGGRNCLAVLIHRNKTPGLVTTQGLAEGPLPNGGQPLYSADVTLSAGGSVQDRTVFKFGVREFTYPIDGNRLSIYCNGARVLAKGGNWGMDDGLKTDTPEKYDDKMRLHAEENYTMIRNWVGMTNNRAFYDAADKYGILIWDDLWLANPVDGPNPDDETMFLDNAADKIKKNRYHAALVLYCGRNESSPPKTLDNGLRQRTQDYDGTRIYFPNSAGGPVGSGGGYAIAAMPNRNNGTGIKEYFDEVPYVTLRSECGIPNVPGLESMKKFLPGEKLWPINESWALHDWTYHMNGPANTYMDALQLYKPGAFTVPTDNVRGQKPDPNDPVFVQYRKDVLEMVEAAGRAYTLPEFHRIAQLINYENFKGVYEGLTVKRSNGFLMWMSQSSWPSFMWQTYDWYLDTNAGYFGAKAANQPTHAVWDPREDAIVLSNMTPKTFDNVATNMKVFDLDGRVVSEQTWNTPVLGPDAYGIRLATATADFAKSPTELIFIRLTVKDGSGNVLGDTLHWHNWKNYMHYESLNDVPEVRLRSSVAPKSAVAGEIGRGNDLYVI